MKPIRYKDHIWYYPNSTGLTETEYYNEITTGLETEIAKVDAEVKILNTSLRAEKTLVSYAQLRIWRRRRINLKKFRTELKLTLDLLQK